MSRRCLPVVRIPALAALGLFLTAAPSVAWPLGGPLYSSRYPVSPSQFGYNLDDTSAGYYGGSRYREYYNYGRGYGLANFPGPLPNFPVPGPFRGYRVVVPPPALPPSALPLIFSKADAAAYLTVRVPDDAELWLEGTKTRQTGTVRTFLTPPLTPGQEYSYDIRAKWMEDGRVIEQTQTAVIRAGDRLDVAFPMSSEVETLPAPRPYRPGDGK